VEEQCRVAVMLESLNDIKDTMFMIPTLEVEDELENFVSKRQHVGNDLDLVDCHQSDDLQVEVPNSLKLTLP